MQCGKKSVVRVAQRVAAPVPVQGLSSEEELIILLMMKVSDRDQNVKGKNVGCVKLISNLCNNLPTEEYVSCCILPREIYVF